MQRTWAEPCASRRPLVGPCDVEDFSSERRLVVREEAAVMFRDDLGTVLDCVACLFIGAGLFEHMRCEYVANIVRSVRQQALDRAATGVGIIDAVTLNREPPRFAYRDDPRYPRY